jgi:hypothetical protein
MIAPPSLPSHDELEALIKEARARQVRRRLLGAAGVAIVAAAVLSTYALATGGAGRPTQVRAKSPSEAATACSLAGGWSIKLAGSWPEPTGQHTAPVALTRTGASACTLTGYPAISLLDANGQTLGFRYSHGGDLVVAAHAPRTVHVGAHRSAYFLLNKYRCDARATNLGRWLRVSLPGVRGRLLLRLPHYPMLDYCPVAPQSTTIAVSPIVSRLTQATARLP